MPLAKAAVIQGGCLLSTLRAISIYENVFLRPEVGPWVSSTVTLNKHAIQKCSKTSTSFTLLNRKVQSVSYIISYFSLILSDLKIVNYTFLTSLSFM